VSQRPIDVRSVHGGVAACAPARAAAHERGVRHVANEKVAAHCVHLRVALKAKVVVALHEHLVGNRAMRVVTDRAAFTECFMLVNDWPRLFAMALRARFIEPSHSRLGAHTERGPMRCFENVRPVRIVALRAVHPLLQDRMMVRKSELRVHLHMTVQAGRRLSTRINDQLSPAPGLDMQAAGPMAGFATGGLAARQVGDVNARVWTGGKEAREICVAIGARFVADKGRSFNAGHRSDGRGEVGTRNEGKSNRHKSRHQDDGKGARSAPRQSSAIHLCVRF